MKMVKLDFLFLLSFAQIAFLLIKFQATNGSPSSDKNSRGLPRNSPAEKEVRLVHYAGSDINSVISTSYSNNNITDIVEIIDPTKPLVLYVHGFREKPSSGSVRTVADAYLRRGDHTFVVIDWSHYSYGFYPILLLEVKQIAKHMAKMLDTLANRGLHPENLHIIGHSMGAQLAGFLARHTSFEVPRVTALDPASPGYYQFKFDHLKASDAKFVDVIHTDGGFYGAASATGTVDCYANGGSRPQPGCPSFGLPLTSNETCSHRRSWQLWAESLGNEKALMAVKCDSLSSFLKRKCSGNEREYCGFAMPVDKIGEYYFDTNSESPFGQGENGIHEN